ncbi:alpha-L-rhamnosidase [Verrucomicrobia bacterium LW23]|nr:alpha-L-rhamnosidase [Verrucomicrobia bacterium LW23]
MSSPTQAVAPIAAAVDVIADVSVAATLPPVALTSVTLQSPVGVSKPGAGVLMLDFGRVAFGNLRLAAAALAKAGDVSGGEVVFHLGEALDAATGRINRTPPGSVRYARATWKWREWLAAHPHAAHAIIAPPADKRNTGPEAVALPPEWGVMLPFRWVEIEGWPEGADVPSPQPDATPPIQRAAAFATTWRDDAAAFACPDAMLAAIWELCRYSIKATTFAGVYVDGDRERIPYEADAYINQLCHYAADPDPAMARETFDWLMRAPTWPTEWASHMIFIAHADWMFTGDTAWLRAALPSVQPQNRSAENSPLGAAVALRAGTSRYEALKSKLLPGRERADGLIASSPGQVKRGDLVDWPPGERDSFDFTEVNAVINAFQYRALGEMAALAEALGIAADATLYRERAATLHAAFQRAFFRPDAAGGGLYADGESSSHISLHGNMFALAFGLVPAERRAAVVAYLKTRGMACSVYPAQYLLEALFEAGEADYALQLICPPAGTPGDRNWRHMVESGTTITWEAWDQRYKPNQDWNHAWGAAPGNILPRYVLGVRPLAPGYTRVSVRPQLGPLEWATGTVPTIHGPIHVQARRNAATGHVEMRVIAPAGVAVVTES